MRCVCVCLGLGVRCAPPHLAGVLGCVCVCVRAPPVPRQSLLGCAVWVCVLGPLLRPRPATPGWAVRVSVCLCARSACTPPLLAGVWGVCVCAWVPVLAEPRHSWLGCWGLCALVIALLLYPATPALVVQCGCVCLGSGFGCAPPLLLGVLGCLPVCVRASLVPPGFFPWDVPCGCVCLGLGVGCAPPLLAEVWGVCVFVCALRLYSATHGWGVRYGLGCLGIYFGCASPLLAGVWGVCVCVPAPLVPRHSWLGCAVRVCVLGPLFRLRPATPGSGSGMSVCLCAPSACTPPPLAEVCGVSVCFWAWVSAARSHFWLGCSSVSVFVCALRLYPATPGWGMR